MYLLTSSQIYPQLAKFSQFYRHGRYRRPLDRSQRLTYIFLMCQTQTRCPFIVDPAQSDHLRGITHCCWCTCATKIGQIFFTIGFT